SVLAGHAAPAGDALVKDLVARREDALHLIRVALVEEQERVDVAVAGVEDVADPQAVLGADLAPPPEHVRQLRPRHDPVLRAQARRDPAQRPERLLAALPEQQPLRFGRRPAAFAGLVLAA